MCSLFNPNIIINTIAKPVLLKSFSMNLVLHRLFRIPPKELFLLEWVSRVIRPLFSPVDNGKPLFVSIW